MARIKARVQVHLPYDVNGTTASPGQIIEVDTDHPQIIGYLEGGLLYALDPLEFPGELQPPAATAEDAAADAAADAPDPGEPGSTLGRDGKPLKDAGDPIEPAELEEQAAAEREDAQGDAETAASGDDTTSRGDGASESDEPQEPRTRPSRGTK